MPAGDDDYEGVAYADMVFEDIDWSEVGEHDPSHRAERRGTGEQNVQTEWATEACQDGDRWVRSAGSQKGLTVKVTGYSAMAGFVVTVIVAPKERPPARRWWGCDGVGSQAVGDHRVRGGAMSESIHETLAREAVEAERRADAEQRGEVVSTPGQRGRRRATDPSQVYPVRIPVSRLRQLRSLAERLDVPPTVLIRRWVLERLDEFDREQGEEILDPVLRGGGSLGANRLRLGRKRPTVGRPAADDQVVTGGG